MRKIFSFLAIFAILLNLSLPVLAQEVTPTPEVTPEPTATPTPEATPSPAGEPDLTPAPEVTPSATPAPVVEQPTYSNVVINNDYQAPQNISVKVRFSILPEGSGSLTIKEVKLSPEQIAATGALSDTAYDITSSMSDNTFQYDLTLPLPPNVQNVEVKSAENTDLSDAVKVSEPEEKAVDTITILGLNHFTVFVVTTPSPDTTQRVLINEALPVPSAGGEWIELFNNGTTAVNLGEGTGWTIKNSANATFSLASLGTIPAAGRVVFEVIPGAGLLSDVAPETITLINELGSTIDTVTINLTAPGFAIDHYPLAGESVGRETDGIGRWVIFTSPSKGTANAIPVPATGFVEVGPVAPAGGLMAGFPSWYKDSNGIALDLHEAPDGGFSISDPPDPAIPFSVEVGFNAEGFWWSAEASIDRPIGTRAILVLALEATFAGEAAVDGEQSAQNRLRYRIDGLVPGEIYTITHPFGQVDEIADADGVINVTDDTGCFAGGGATCNQTATPNFSTPLSGQVGPFLTWTTFNTNPTLTDPQLTNPANPGRRYVGKPAVPHAVTGSPTGNNLFRVEGLNVGGPGVNFIETALFTVSGRLADANAPVITLFGANPVNVIQGAVYADAGATALDDQGGNLTGSMQVTGLPVDTATLGEKTVTYTVTDGASRTTVATRIVNVIAAGGVDTTAPVITRNGAASVDVVQGTVYTDLGATCLDDTDGNCTASIVTVNPVNTANLGAQLVTYNFTDAAGNPAIEVTRIVNVVADTIPPVITILGSNVVNILAGATYADDGAIATDNVNGSVTANIVSTGLPVDTTIIRENTVTYTVTDSAGNSATATRTVNVVATLPSGLSAVSAINPDNGYPTWYKDSAGIAIQLCLAGADGLADGNCTLPGAGEEPNFNPALPVSFPDNFPGEAFWYLAEPDVVTNAGQTGQGRVRFRYALESAFTTEAPTPNEQIAFLRVNMQPIADLVPGATYTVTHPFGSFTVHAGDALLEDGVTPNPSAGVADDGRFFRVEDGAFFPPLTEVTAASILPAANTGISTFLKQANPLPPAGYIGDGATLSTIEAGPNGNFVRIEGPGIDVNNYDGDGNPDSLTIDTWTVSGKLADITPPVITVTGANPDTVTQGTAYTDPGATCSDDFDGNCTGLMTTNGLPVNTATLDPKTITYSYTDRSGNAGSAQRIVNVVAAGPDITAPVITLNGANPFEVAEGTAYAEPGATALDLGGDGDISANIATVSNVPAGALTLGTGPFTVTYNVSDAAGNAAVEVVRTVNVIAAPPADTTAPVVTPNGAVSITMAVGATYTELGALATDAVDGVLPVTTTGTVNTAVADTYTITYTATDAAGNVGTATRTVTVIEVTPATATIAITPSAPTIINAAAQTFTAPVVTTGGSPVVGATATFTSAIPSVGTINAATGVFTPTGAGTTTITATSGTASATTIVTVSAVATHLSVSPLTPTVQVGNSLQTSGLLHDQFGAPMSGSIIYSSSNPAVGLINPQTGIFTPLSAGSTTITATSGAVSGSTIITVSAAPVADDLREILLSAPTETTSVGGASIQLAVTVVSGAATTFSSNNTNVATIDGNGLITPVGAGRATIRVTSTKGQTTVTKDFRVTVELPVESTNLASLITNNVFQPAAGSSGPGSTPSITVAAPVSINVAGTGGRNHKVRIPQGTVITRFDGALLDATAITALQPGLDDIGGIVTGTAIGTLQWGLNGVTLQFNPSVILKINVGAENAGQILNVMRSANGNTAWTIEGLASPTCVVDALGDCQIETTMASFFAAIQPATTTSTTTTSSGSSSSSNGLVSAPVCGDTKPQSAPVLTVAAVRENEVDLTWTKAADPVTYYLVAYGTSSGNMRYGNPNVGNTNFFTVKGLSGGQTYFFKVRAGNNCMPGDFSNEVSVTPSGAVVTGAAEGFEEEVLGAEAKVEAEQQENIEGNVGIGQVLGESAIAGGSNVLGNLIKVSVAVVLILAVILGVSIYKRRQV